MADKKDSARARKFRPSYVDIPIESEFRPKGTVVRLIFLGNLKPPNEFLEERNRQFEDKASNSAGPLLTHP